MRTHIHIQQHPARVALHNEIHARPPEAMTAPVAISHVVMVCDAEQRQASREHVATLLRDHHLPLPDSPVMTTNWSRGMSTSMFFKLCCRAPRTVICLMLIQVTQRENPSIAETSILTNF